jgi:hypothetical protein
MYGNMLPYHRIQVDEDEKSTQEMLRTREAGNDTGSKLKALIRLLCKCVERRELDSVRKSGPDSLDMSTGFDFEATSCGSISSSTELNRTAGDSSAVFCVSKAASSFFKVSRSSSVSNVS